MKAKLLLYFFSLLVVAFGQPARIGELGAIAACCGFSLFFFSLSESLSAKKRFTASVIWFSLVQLIQLSWLATTEFQGIYILFVYAFLSIALGLQFGIFVHFIPKKGAISLLQVGALSGLWTLFEWLRLLPLCGLSFNPVGLSLTHSLSSLQLASVFGILGLSFWVMFTNLCGLNAMRGKARQQFLSFAIVGMIPYLFGWLTLSYPGEKMENPIRVAIVETDLLPSEKVLTYEREEDFILPSVQWEIIVDLLKMEREKEWDVIVFPEAVLPYSADIPLYVFEDVRHYLFSRFGEFPLPPLQWPYAIKKEVWWVSNLFWCQALANLFQSDIIIGLDHQDKSAGKNYNSSFYLKSGGSTVQRYDKQILLPMAEHLPFPFLSSLVRHYGISDFFSPGTSAQIFNGKFAYAPSICYEDTFSGLMRRAACQGPDLFVNLTNDNYFPGSSLHRQHLFHARVRAVENGIPLVRSCNSGISAIIDSCGRIQQTLTPARKQGIISKSFTIHKKRTLYTFWGDAGIIVFSLGFYCIFLMKSLSRKIESLTL